MSMTIPELHRALRSLRLSGMVASIEARALQVSRHEMNLLEGFSWLVQDEPDRRRSRLLERRHSTSGLSERKDLAAVDWTYNPKLPRREILEIATLKFIEAREGALLIGQPAPAKATAPRPSRSWPCSVATEPSTAKRTYCCRKSTKRASSASCASTAHRSTPRS